MHRSFVILILASVTAFVASGFSQWVWEGKVTYYISNGYDVPVVLWFGVLGPLALLCGIGALVRRRSEFVAAWSGSTVFFFLGSLAGAPRLESTFDTVLGLLGTGAVTGVPLLIGLSLYWLWNRVANQRLTVVCS